MKILVPVKRVVDYNVKVRVKADGSGVDLKPSITFGHDVKGWSYDSLFIEGRRLAIVALQADVKKRFFVEASWTPIWGGRYNFAKDRDLFALAVGATF